LKALCTQKCNDSIGDATCEAVFIASLIQPTSLFFVSKKSTFDQHGRAGSSVNHGEPSFFRSPVFSFGTTACYPLNRLRQFLASSIFEFNRRRDFQPILDESDRLQALGITEIGLQTVDGGCIFDCRVKMHTDESGRVGVVGDFGSFFQGDKHIFVSRHQDTQALFFKMSLQSLSDVESRVFFDQLIGDSASIMASVSGIDHHQRWLGIPRLTPLIISRPKCQRPHPERPNSNGHRRVSDKRTSKDDEQLFQKKRDLKADLVYRL